MNGSASFGISCVPDGDLAVREVTGLEALGPSARGLFGQDGVFSTLGWYRSTIGHALPGETRAVFVAISRGDETRALFPMQRGTGAAFSALTTPYTCLWQPLFAAAARWNAGEMAEIGKAFAGACGRTPATRLEAMDVDAPWLPPLLEGIRDAGLYPLRFGHFGNWHEDVSGLGWETYLAARPGALREAIRRRGRKLMDKMGAQLTITDGSVGLEPAIAAYEKIYGASWKEPEPFAFFNADFMRRTAEDSTLRLGILSLADRPLAAQFWVVRDGCATVLKLAHDEASRALSPGTVLTALMIRHMLEDEHVCALDFGRGDDDYKKDWVGARRQRIGFLLANPRSVYGGATILRHFMGKLRRKTNPPYAGIPR